MEYVINPGHRAPAALKAANVANVELDLVCNVRVLGLILMTHVVLLLFVAGEDTDLADVRAQEALEDGISEGPCSSGNHEGFVFKNGHNLVYLFIL